MSEPGSPRKQSDVSLRQKPKKKSTNPEKKNRGKKSPVKELPFMEQDEFSDVTIKVDDKRMFSNSCLLSYNSSVWMKQLADSSSGGGGGGGGGKEKSKEKSKPSAPSNKELDLSDKRFTDVRELLSFIDPRVECTLTDEESIRLLPLAEEYDMKTLMKGCEQALTQSFYKMRKGRRVGSVPTDVTLRYLAAADKYKCEDLSNMCIDECVANDNPFGSRAVTDCNELSEGVKVRILDKRLEKVNLALVRERRNRADQEQMRESGGKIWKKQ